MPTWTFQNSGWRQGAVIPRQYIPQGVLPAGIDEQARFIVVSHDCDIVQQPEAEPFIEFVIARPLQPERKDGRLFGARNPRKLQFWVMQDNDRRLYEVSAHDRFNIQRQHLENHEPDSEISLNERDVTALALWLSRRYKRSSFPTEFNKRVPPKAWEKIRNVLKRDGEDVTLFMVLNSFDELPAGKSYDALVRVIVPTAVLEDDYREQRALTVVTAIRANISACPGINLIDVKLESEAQFTLEDLYNTIQWDAYDYLSTPPGENPE